MILDNPYLPPHLKVLLFTHKEGQLSLYLTEKGKLPKAKELPLILHPTQSLPLLQKALCFYQADLPLPTRQVQSLEHLSFSDGAMLCEALSFFWPSPLSPYSHSRFTSLKGFMAPESLDGVELTFFGGTFYPWHDGHLFCVEQFCSQKDHPPLIIVLDFNPFKIGHKRPDPWKHYKEMVERFQDFSQKVFVYPRFCGATFPNPTYYWTKELGRPFSLLMGGDSFTTLPEWKEAALLIKNIKRIWVTTRQENDQQRQQSLNWLKGHASHIELSFFEAGPFRHLSSTLLRQRSDF